MPDISKMNGITLSILHRGYAVLWAWPKPIEIGRIIKGPYYGTDELEGHPFKVMQETNREDFYQHLEIAWPGEKIDPLPPPGSHFYRVVTD